MARKKPVPYVNNKVFLEAIVKYKAELREAEDSGEEAPRVPKYIGECIYQIANRLAFRPNFINYSYRDEMISDGLEVAIAVVDKFNPEKSSNPFAYFTQVIYFAFIRRIHREKRQTYVKYKVMQNSMIHGQLAESGEDGAILNVDVTNDHMDDFVGRYEEAANKKKRAAKKKKEGLELFEEQS